MGRLFESDKRWNAGLSFKEDNEVTDETLKIRLKTETKKEETANLVMYVGESNATHGDDAISSEVHMHVACIFVPLQERKYHP